MFPNFLRPLRFPKSSVVRQLVRQVYTILLIITFRFTCGERKMSSTIKKSQNIMNMIAVFKHLFSALRKVLQSFKTLSD